MGPSLKNIHILANIMYGFIFISRTKHIFYILSSFDMENKMIILIKFHGLSSTELCLLFIVCGLLIMFKNVYWYIPPLYKSGLVTTCNDNLIDPSVFSNVYCVQFCFNGFKKTYWVIYIKSRKNTKHKTSHRR